MEVNIYHDFVFPMISLDIYYDEKGYRIYIISSWEDYYIANLISGLIKYR